MLSSSERCEWSGAHQGQCSLSGREEEEHMVNPVINSSESTEIQPSERLLEIVAELQKSLESEDIGSTGFDVWSTHMSGSPLPSVDDQSFFWDSINEMYFEAASTPVHSSDNRLNVVEGGDLENYRPSFSHLTGKRADSSTDRGIGPTKDTRELSTEAVIRAAASHFIQQSGNVEGALDMLGHPFGVSSPVLTEEEMRNICLASLLLAAAEKLSVGQCDRASYFISQCYKFSSSTGNPVQRVVYYFSEALQERIDRQTREMSPKQTSPGKSIAAQDTDESTLTQHPIRLVLHEKLPFAQVTQFISVQAIIDNVASAKRIHMIDLSINHGIQWTILMQALAMRFTCPVEYLKITAVGTSEEAIAVSGKRLVSFAETLNLHFKFKTVIVKDMIDLKEELFETDEGEVLSVYSSLDMSTMVVRPDSLGNLMKVLRVLRPSIITVTDVEAKHNSTNFINRFTEALFYYSAIFDSLADSMDRNDVDRMFVEESCFLQAITSIIATEGSERVVRHVGLSVWRQFFARFGLVEAELNEWSLFQARLLVKQFLHGSSCTIGKSGKCLLIGWKDTPLFFISAWKFIR